MSAFVVRPQGSTDVWSVVNAATADDAARVAAKRCKRGEGSTKRKPLNMPKAWDVAPLRTGEHLGEVSEREGCVCSTAATILKMFDLGARVTVRL